MEESLSEPNLEKNKQTIVAVVGAMFSLVVALVNYLAGVDPVLNVAIVLCIFIVLVGSLAYAKHEKKEIEAKIEDEILDSIDEIMPRMEKILNLLDDVDSRVRECSELIDSSGRRVSDSTNSQLKAVLQIRERLGERASVVRTMIDSRDDEKIREAKDMINQPLTFPVDSLNSLVVSTVTLPDLPYDQWEPTLYSILERVKKEVESLA